MTRVLWAAAHNTRANSPERPRPGEWNDQEIRADGRSITIRLNGVLILDANLDGVKEPEVLKNHPGLLRKSGHIVLLGHQAYVEFRKLRIKELP